MGVIIKQGIKGTLINYIGAGIGAISTMFIVTKFLTPEDVGLTAVIWEVAALFSSLAILGTSSSIMRFFPYFKDEKKKHNGFFFYIIALPFIGCLIFIPLYIILKEPICNFLAKSSEYSELFVSYYYWVIPLILIITYWSIFENYSNANMRIVFPKFTREVLIKAMLIVVYVFFGVHILNRDGFVGAYIGVYGVAMFLTFVYVLKIAPTSLKHDNSFISPSLRKDIARYTLFLIIGTLGTNILSKLDIFMVTSELGLDYTGIYRIAFYMGIMVDIPARSITAISSPVAAAALRNGDLNEANQLYKKVSLHQLLIGGLMFVLLWSNIDNIFAIIPNGEIYAYGKWVVLFIGISKLFEITLNFGGILISFSKYYYWSLIFVFLITGVGIFTNYLFIPHFGISGAAIATLISTLLSCSFQQWIVLRKIKGNPYSTGTLKTVFIVILLLGISFILPQLANPWIDAIYRTAILGVITLPLVYFTNISPEVNNIVLMIFEKTGIKK